MVYLSPIKNSFSFSDSLSIYLSTYTPIQPASQPSVRQVSPSISLNNCSQHLLKLSFISYFHLIFTLSYLTLLLSILSFFSLTCSPRSNCRHLILGACQSWLSINYWYLLLLYFSFNRCQNTADIFRMNLLLLVYCFF